MISVNYLPILDGKVLTVVPADHMIIAARPLPPSGEAFADIGCIAIEHGASVILAALQGCIYIIGPTEKVLLTIEALKARTDGTVHVNQHSGGVADA